ncbi:MAG TPA: HepT-like ribonuclease domain-containing protein [Bryobacteraceae bacterium]|nr:HepT-like ribonuclease domain-containing protein [Bryobacteraceae bacterium]
MIETFTAGMDFEAFRVDPKTVAAVERKLQVVSEAAVRLGSNAETRCPGLPWREIRGMGNWLRHQYERTELAVIWKTIQDDLPRLKAAVLYALGPLGTNPPEPSPGL